MNIKLIRLKVESFKGLRFFEFKPDGENATVQAENGVGKTTIYDAFLWLLFGKDSTGRSDFAVRPLDENNHPIKGLVLAVEAELSIDGATHTFRKEHHEKVVKDQLRGYETLCWIDEVPKKVSEFQESINEIIPEDTFKMLTDSTYFNSKLHWSKRRQVLLDIAGDIGSPEGFDGLLAKLNGRTIDEYKSVLTNEKKRYTKERDEINPRIDEISRNLESAETGDKSELESKRGELQNAIGKLNKQRTELYNQEHERQKQQDKLNELKAKKAEREAELKNDTSGVEKLLNEKNRLKTELSDSERGLSDIENEIQNLKTKYTSKQYEYNSESKQLDKLRDEIVKLDQQKVEKNCYACGQELPATKVDELIQKKEAEKQKIIEQGKKQRQKIDALKKEIDELDKQIREKQGQRAELQEAHKKRVAETANRIGEIENKIENRETPNPENDDKWNDIVKQIEQAEKELGEPVSSQLEKIENEKTEREKDLQKINENLAQFDRIKKDKERIAELEAREKELAQKIADVNAQLKQIDDYKVQETNLLKEAVNGKFKYVQFKLFEEKLNGSIGETCVATYNGVPFSDLSTGQKILTGVDVVNVLSEHYGCKVSMFIDHAESLTIPIESNTQTIKLFAVEGVKELQVEKEKELVKN